MKKLILLSMITVLMLGNQDLNAQNCIYRFTATPVPCTNSIQFQTYDGCAIGNDILDVRFVLEFGDGTDTVVQGGGQINITHMYPSGGSYIPTITTSIFILTSLGNLIWANTGSWPDLYDNVSDEVQAGIRINADGPTTFCGGNSVTLSATTVSGASYQWLRNNTNVAGATSRTYTAKTSGSYTCKATCGGSTLTSNAIPVVSKANAAATLSASGPSSFCAGDSVVLQSTNPGVNYSVRWLRTNVLMENSNQYTQVVKQPGTYKVITTNLSNNCFRVSSSSVVVAVNCRLANPEVVATNITESDFAARSMDEEPKGKIYIYPNPSSDDRFTLEFISLEQDGPARLEIYNGMGQLLNTEQVLIADGYLQRTITVSTITKGQLHLVRLLVGNDVYDSKVVLK
jgi:hypothetical protein